MRLNDRRRSFSRMPSVVWASVRECHLTSEQSRFSVFGSCYRGNTSPHACDQLRVGDGDRARCDGLEHQVAPRRDRPTHPRPRTPGVAAVRRARDETATRPHDGHSVEGDSRPSSLDRSGTAKTPHIAKSAETAETLTIRLGQRPGMSPEPNSRVCDSWGRGRGQETGTPRGASKMTDRVFVLVGVFAVAFIFVGAWLRGSLGFAIFCAAVVGVGFAIAVWVAPKIFR